MSLMDILTYINKMNRLYGSEQQVARLPYGTSGTYGVPESEPMPNIPDLIREEGVQVGQQVKDGGRIYDTRKYFNRGQLVQPGPGRQGYEGSEKRAKVELTEDQTIEFRKRVEKRAKSRNFPKPNWNDYPATGYSSLDNRKAQTMAADAKRNLLKNRPPKDWTPLSKPDQDLIKKRFTLPEGVEKWNFKDYKYGIEKTTPGGTNYKLGQKIRNVIKGTISANFAFDHFDKANYHLTQMHRAANLKVPNKNYIPIYSTKGIIGYKDLTQNGKEYYHSKYNGLDSQGKKALLINKNHPDADNINKLLDIVEGTKQDRSVLDSLFKKHGHKTPTFNQLLDSLMETEGRWLISSAIEKHHQHGVGRKPGLIQLITRDKNQFAKLIEGRVDSGKMTTKTAHELLKPMGVQIVRDGKKIGAPDISPEKQIKDWKKWVSRQAKTNPEQFLKLAGFNFSHCKLKENGGSYNTCVRDTIEAEQKKALNNDAKAKAKFGKMGKLARGAGMFFGWVDIPIELAFALPHMLRGDVNAAKRATTLGLVGYGSDKELDIAKRKSPMAYRSMKRKRDVDNYINNWFRSETDKQTLETAPEEFKSDLEQNITTSLTNMENIAKNFPAADPETMYREDKRKREYIREEAEKRARAGLTVGGVKFAPGAEGQKLDTLEKYIKYKGEPYWKNIEPMLEDINDLSALHPYQTRDERDRYSELPTKFASQLGPLEAKETQTALDYLESEKIPFYNTGGRVPFGKGKLVDKGRRAFMKWLAGITGAGIAAGTGLIKFGKFAGKGKTVIKAGDHIIQGTPGMPDWFIPLINRIVKEGDDVTKKLGTIEREIVHTKKLMNLKKSPFIEI